MTGESHMDAGSSGSRRSRHRGTEEEHDLLRREYRGTAQSLSDLAERLGVSEYSVRNQLSKLGLGRTRLMPYHRWMQEERELLRRERPRRTGRELAGMLGVTGAALRNQVAKMGLDRKRRRPYHRWTDDERNLIRREYDETLQSRQDLALKLGVSEGAVAGQVGKLGLGRRTGRNPWTPDEEELLRELVSQMPVDEVAGTLHRSRYAVIAKARQLGVSPRDRDGWYTRQEVCELLGVDAQWLQRRIDGGALKASRFHGDGPDPWGRTWRIEARDLRRFIRRFCHELTGRNVDLEQIVELLAGRGRVSPGVERQWPRAPAGRN